MSVNVALEDVPWAILEMVKARIMRNRRDLELSEDVQEQTTTKPVTALQSIGARGKRWGEEEPAATLELAGAGFDICLAPTSDYQTNQIIKGLARLPAYKNWLAKFAPEPAFFQANFDFVANGGPVEQTSAMRVPVSPSGPSTFDLISSPLLVNIQSANGLIQDVQDTETGFTVFNPLTNSYVLPTPRLPSIVYAAFTLEVIVKLGPANKDQNNTELEFFLNFTSADVFAGLTFLVRGDAIYSAGADETTPTTFVRTEYAVGFGAAFGGPNIQYAAGYDDSTKEDPNQFIHLAIVKSGSVISYYVKGVLRATQQDVPPNSGPFVVQHLVRGLHQRSSINPTGAAAIDGNPLAFHGYRFTPGRALYTGATFTPPASITRLA